MNFTTYLQEKITDYKKLPDKWKKIIAKEFGTGNLEFIGNSTLKAESPNQFYDFIRELRKDYTSGNGRRYGIMEIDGDIKFVIYADYKNTVGGVMYSIVDASGKSNIQESNTSAGRYILSTLAKEFSEDPAEYSEMLFKNSKIELSIAKISADNIEKQSDRSDNRKNKNNTGITKDVANSVIAKINIKVQEYIKQELPESVKYFKEYGDLKEYVKKIENDLLIAKKIETDILFLQRIVNKSGNTRNKDSSADSFIIKLFKKLGKKIDVEELKKQYEEDEDEFIY